MTGTLLSVGTPLIFMRKQFNVPVLETQTHTPPSQKKRLIINNLVLVTQSHKTQNKPPTWQHTVHNKWKILNFHLQAFMSKHTISRHTKKKANLCVCVCVKICHQVTVSLIVRNLLPVPYNCQFKVHTYGKC